MKHSPFCRSTFLPFARAAAGAAMLLFAGMLAPAPEARAAEDGPREFANLRTLTLRGADAVYQVEVPAGVYEGVVRPDLGDVRIFNAADEPVPLALLPRERTQRVEPARITVPLFPLRGPAGTAPDAFDVRIEQGGGRTSIRVVAPNVASGAAAPAQPVLAWIADGTAIEEPVRAFTLAGLPVGTFARVRVEASDDLKQWRTVADAAPVVTLREGEATIERTRVEIAPTVAKYWRITGVGEITGVTAEAGDIAADAPRTWRRVSPTAARAAEGEYEFDVRGRFPADRFRLVLPQANTVANVQLLSRARASDPWQEVTRGLVYRMSRDGVELASGDLRGVSHGHRLWLLRVDRRGGGLGAGEPALEIGWVPDRLLFVARGAPPFSIGFGSHHATPAAFTVDQIQPGWRPGDRVRASVAAVEGIETAPAATGTAKGAPAAIREAQKPFDMRLAALYGALGLGVVVLGAMAWTLTRRMRGAPGTPAQGGAPAPEDASSRGPGAGA